MEQLTEIMPKIKETVRDEEFEILIKIIGKSAWKEEGYKEWKDQ